MRLAGVIGDGDDHLRALARNGGHRRALTQVNPLGHQTAAQHVDQHRIVLDHDPGHFDHRHGGPQTAMGLSHLNADGATAQNDQMARRFFKVEDRLIR